MYEDSISLNSRLILDIYGPLWSYALGQWNFGKPNHGSVLPACLGQRTGFFLVLAGFLYVVCLCACCLDAVIGLQSWASEGARLLLRLLQRKQQMSAKEQNKIKACQIMSDMGELVAHCKHKPIYHIWNPWRIEIPISCACSTPRDSECEMSTIQESKASINERAATTETLRQCPGLEATPNATLSHFQWLDGLVALRS